jgi:hypothetical protein
MHTQTQQQANSFATTGGSSLPPTQKSSYLTVSQFSEANPAFTESAIRNLIFKAEERQSSRETIPGNGLIESGAIVRLGRKVLINETRFFEWLESQQKGGRKS